MPLLTPTERVTLEMIRDLGFVPPARLEWAKAKGYAEPNPERKGKHRLTNEGSGALASDAKERLQRRRQQASQAMRSPFARPWRIIEHEESFEIQSAAEHALARVCFENEEGRRGVMKRLTREDARRLAHQILQLPETLRQLCAARDEPA
jgi:hypothetical protein